MATRDYRTDDITIHWDSGVCIHSGHCAKTLSAVFDPKRRPWVDPYGASADEVAAAVDGCPSGALKYTRHDGGADGAGARGTAEPTEAGSEAVRVTISENGPLEVVGEVDLVDADGNLVRRTSKAYFCRCGHSRSKPYCDGSHKRTGFEDSGRPAK